MGAFLGIDVGTSGTKTLAIDEKGRILAEAAAEYPCYYPKPLWSEQDPEDWWKGTVASVQAVVKEGRLTGEFATEVSDASGMLLLDVVKRRWSKKLLEKLELDESLLATCYESEQVTGKLRPEVAKELGLSPSCVVVGGAGDCAANAVG